MILALALSPSLDITYEVPRLRHGDITRPTAVTRVAGGKALNVARVAAALGGRVRTVVALGGHTGTWVRDLLTGDGIEAAVVPLRRVTRSCIAVVEEAGASSSTDLYEPATPLDAAEWRAFAQKAVDAAAEAPCRVVVSGSLPAGVPSAELAEALARIRSAGGWIAVDSSGEGLQAMAPHADLLKVNRREAGELLAEDLAADAASAAMAARYGADVIVTDGVDGAAAVIDGEPLRVAGPTRLGRFSAGSGDAFLGGLLAALDSGAAAASALEHARHAAERNALVPGQGVLAAR